MPRRRPRRGCTFAVRDCDDDGLCSKETLAGADRVSEHGRAVARESHRRVLRKFLFHEDGYPRPRSARRDDTQVQAAAAQWQAADPATPVIPALDYIVVVAQGSAGKDGMYRARMPDSEIQKAIDLMAPLHGIVFLDVQTGLSTLHDELPLLTPFLKLPNVELSVDPEFYMAYSGKKPGGVIGTMDASDVNYAAGFLANIVRQNNLPPKILVVHRFTEEMVTHATKIVPLPEVQVVMDMDGWGTQAKKIGTYINVIAAEPVQFTGFKLFYKNDVKAPSTSMYTPAQVLNLTPAPSYIQYQ